MRAPRSEWMWLWVTNSYSQGAYAASYKLIFNSRIEGAW